MDYHAWAEFYDAQYAVAPLDEVVFYVGLARESGSPVLEIGVGTGRIAVPTAQAGIEIVGVDLHEPMLGRARSKLADLSLSAGAVELVQADMRSFALGRTFPLVTLPARTLLLATSRNDQLAALVVARHHLAPGGRLVLNVYVPDADRLSDSSDIPFLSGDVVNPESGRRCLIWTTTQYDTANQLDRSVTVVEEIGDDAAVARKVVLEATLRYLFPTEAIELVEEAGMSVLHAWGGFDRRPFDETSEELILVCSGG